MSAFGRYFRYHSRQILIRLVVLASVAGLLSFYFAATRTESRYSGHLEINYNSAMVLISAIATIYTFIIAGLELAPFKNRRNIDLWFSSPLSRNDIMTNVFVSGTVQLAVTTFVSCVVAGIKMAVLNLGGGNYSIFWLFPVFVVTLISCTLVYFLNCFIFLCGNSVFDGCIYLYFFMRLPSLLYTAVMVVTDMFSLGTTEISDLFGNGMSTYYVVFPSYYVNMFNDLICPPERRNAYINSLDRVFDTTVMIVWTILWAALCIACVWFSYRLFNALKSEKLGGPSDFIFGYRILIPAWGILSIISVSNTIWILPVFIILGMFIGYVFFRKGVKLKKEDVIWLIIAGGVTIITQIMSYATGNNMFQNLMRLF